MKRDNRGFSLIELMVTIAIFAVASTALFSLVNTSTTQYQRGNMEVSLQYEAQTVMNQMSDLLIDATKGVSYSYDGIGANMVLSDADIVGTPVSKEIYIYSTDQLYILRWVAADKKILYSSQKKDPSGSWTADATNVLMAEYVEDVSLDLTNGDRAADQSGVIRLKIKFKHNKEYELNQNINLRNTIKINRAMSDVYS